jgi:hypothetical protein
MHSEFAWEILKERDHVVSNGSYRNSIYMGVGTNLAYNRRSLGRYSSLADSGHGVFFYGTELTQDGVKCFELL